MPLYEYVCPKKHVTEKYAGYEDSTAICEIKSCKDLALRRPVYYSQYVSAETGPKGGTKSKPPLAEKSYRHEYKEFMEASQEIDHAYSKVDDPKVRAPNYYKQGVARAQAFEAQHHGKRTLAD